MEDYRLKCWTKYVNDTLVIIERFHKRLQGIFLDIRFTIEYESSSVLTFLDVLVCRDTNVQLSTKEYKRETNTDRLLPLESNHPMVHEIGCIKSLFNRVDSHCSTQKVKAEEQKTL